MTVHCYKICDVNDAVTVPPYPPFWNQVAPVPPDPVLTLVCPVNPASAIVGTAPLQVAANGSLFTATTVAHLDGVPLPTTFISATRIDFTIDPTLETPRIGTISVRDGADSAIMTCPFEFLIAVVKPTVTYVFPDMIGYDETTVRTVTVTGTLFDATSVAMLSGTPMATTFVNATTLTFTTPAGGMWTNGTMTLRVQNGGVIQGLSDTKVNFAVTNNPGISECDPPSAPAGSAPLVVVARGPDLGNSVEVLVDNVPVPTRWLTGVAAEFDVDPSGMTAGTVLQVTVRLGHQHPEGHDDVRVIEAPLSVPFTIV